MALHQHLIVEDKVVRVGEERESRQHLALAIFDWIESWYNPKRRHSYCQMLSPVDYEANRAVAAA